MAAPNLVTIASMVQKLLVSQQLTATTETVVYTVPTGQAVKLAQGSLCNITGSAVTVTLSLIQSGGTVGDGTHRVINSYSLGANDTLPLGDYLGGHMLGDGDKIAVTAGTANAIDVVLSGAVSA
ncbi:MAG: hypothetical protein JWM31_3446 [Solirubrobacterales bacterium]|nr:hypothetical protein [Solirubrobacterales bacterium]